MDKPPVWVFCPLLKGRFPRDRELLERCEKCCHFKGVSHSLKEIEIQRGGLSKPTAIKTKERMPKIMFSREEIEKASHENKIEDEKWLEEERRLHQHKEP